MTRAFTNVKESSRSAEAYLATAQEHDARHGGRHAALEHAHGGCSGLLGRDLLGARLAGRHHVRLEQCALQVDVVHHQRVVYEREHLHNEHSTAQFSVDVLMYVSS